MTKDENEKEQGLSLRDIADIGEEVNVGGDKVLKVKGISAKGCLILLLRFPDMQRWLTGAAISISEVVVQTPDAIGAIIAAGTGEPGDADNEEIASNLSIEIQMALVEAIFRQTFRSGFGPFVKRVLGLYAAAVQSGNFGGDPATKSPQELKPSLPTDTTPSESGTTPPDK